MSWMQQLKRVFHIDIEHCGVCGGTLRFIASRTTGAALILTPHASLMPAVPCGPISRLFEVIRAEPGSYGCWSDRILQSIRSYRVEVT